MMKPEKQKRNNKFYPKTTKKSTKKSKNVATKTALQAVKKREARRKQALKKIPLPDLFKHLQQEETTCPFCGDTSSLTLQTNQHTFSCSSCKKQGNSIRLVKKALNISDWKAISYIENLTISDQKDDISNPQICSLCEAENTIITDEKSGKLYCQACREELPAKKENTSTPNTTNIDIQNQFQKRINKIKGSRKLEDLISQEAEVSFKKSGDNLMCNCPFDDHPDKNPSFSVTPSKQIYHCFGCQRKGDIIQFIQDYKNLSFKETLDYLDPQHLVKSAPTVNGSNITPHKLLLRCQEFFHKCLLNCQVAKDFLSDRGLYDPELFAHFKLGFDDGNINQAINNDIKERLNQMGFLSEKGNVRFYQCLTTGLEDADGNIVSIYGRRIHKNKGSKHQFPKGCIQGIFNSSAFKCSKEIIITEGVIDALSCWTLGYRNVSCIFSASSIPDLLIDQLVRYNIPKVYLALDNDLQGEAACQLLTEKLNDFSIKTYRIEFPTDTKDTNELLVKNGKEQAKCLFTDLITDAKPFVVNTSLIQQNNHNEKSQLKIEWQERKGKVSGGALSYEIELISREKGALRVLLFASRDGKAHTDKLDFFRSQSRHSFAYAAAKRFSVPQERIEQELEELLLQVRNLPKEKKNGNNGPSIFTYSEEEKQHVLTWLKDPDLLAKIPKDYDTLGYVGEYGPKQIAYLSATSRKMESPIPLIIRATSSVGKSALMETTAKLMPDEDVLFLSEISKQALYYLNTERIQHKMIIVDERKGSEEADYSIRTLLSRGLLRKAVPTREADGEIRTIIKETKGPIGYMESTTDVNLDPENENRSLVMYLDDSEKQTHLIQLNQRNYFTKEGRQKRKEAQNVIRRHKIAQRLLKPCLVDIPYVHNLQFPTRWSRTRRDHQKFLCLLSTIAYLHQYQRKQYQENGNLIVVANLQDYEYAYKLAPFILRPAVSDLNEKHYELLTGIDLLIEQKAKKTNLVKQDVTFTRSEICRFLGWQLHQVKGYLPRLVETEHLSLLGSATKGSTFRYIRNYDLADASDPLTWLISPNNLNKKISTCS